MSQSRIRSSIWVLLAEAEAIVAVAGRAVDSHTPMVAAAAKAVSAIR